MYIALIVLLMLVLPVVSIVAEMLIGTDATLLALVGKWFVFWGVGVRLFVAGIRQVTQPSFTAKTIFRIDDPGAEKLVTEIGFGNLSIGLLGLLTLLFPAWLVPTALAGAVFYLLAGIKHVMNRDRSATETIPLVSDLGMGLLLAIWLALTLL